MTTNTSEKREIATLGGGCFWCLEPIYRDLIGVSDVVVGYAGGEGPATYKRVSTGTTGYAEVAQISFDPDKITFEEILKVFFTIHDPTTLNRQGADVGTQYRSVIFYHDEEQKEIVEKVIVEFAADLWDDPIVTEITPLDEFHRAENYHQRYYEHNPNQGYCRVVISPKVAKFRKKFADKLKSNQ